MIEDQAAWRARVAEHVERLGEKAGVRDREQLRQAAREAGEEVFELVLGRVPELTAAALTAAMEAAAAPNDARARKRNQKAARAAEEASKHHVRKLGVAWLTACLHATDGDRRMLLMALGVDRPGSALRGASWLEAVRAIGLDPHQAARSAAIAFLDAVGVEIQPLDDVARGDVKKVLERRFTAAPSTMSMH